MLDNDSDADGDSLSIDSIVTYPQHGTVKRVGSRVKYTPDSGYSGNDSFTYRASDGKDASNIATVNITINKKEDNSGNFWNWGSGNNGGGWGSWF